MLSNDVLMLEQRVFGEGEIRPGRCLRQREVKEECGVEVEIVNRPAFTVVGIMYHGKNEANEVPRLWGELWSRSKEIKNRVDPSVAYGVLGKKDCDSGEFDYMAGLEVDSVADVPEGMDSWEVPEQTYAVFACTLPTLMETMQYAFETWLPQSAYERADGPGFELYGEDFDHEERPAMSLFIPISAPGTPAR
jgi:predicted transcriptional regulator YdeE